MKITVGSPRVLSVLVDNGISYVTEMDLSSRTPCVHNFFTVDTPFDTVSESGQVVCSEIFRENFQNACKTHKISAEKVIFTINSGRIINREITVPYVRSSKVESVIISNASEYFPLDITDFKMVHKVNETISDQNGKRLKVSVCAVPKDILSSYYDLAAFLSLEIENIDYVGNSVFRFLKMFERPLATEPEGTNTVKVYMSMNSSSTVLSFVMQGEAKLQRHIGIGYGGVLEYATGISKKSAEAVMYSSTDPFDINEPPKDDLIFGIHYDEKEWKKNTIGSLDGLCSSISRSIDYFETLFESTNLDYKLYLVGPAVKIGGIKEYLEEGLRSTVTVPDVVLGKKNINVKKCAGFPATEYAMCVGAIIAPLNLSDKSVAKSVPMLEVFKDSSVQSLLLMLGISVFTICVAVSVCLWYLPQSENNKLKAQAQELKDKMQTLSGAQTVKTEFEKWEDIKESVSGINTYLYTYNDKLVYFIEEFERKMPESFSAKNITISEKGVSMTVSVDSRYEAAYVIMTLREMKSIKVTSISNSFTFGQVGSNTPDDKFTVISDQEYALIESKLVGIDWVAFDFTTLDPELFKLFGIDIDDYIDKEGNLIHKNIAPEYQNFSDDEIRVGLNDGRINFFDLFMIKKESDVGASTEGSAKSVSITVSMEYTGEFEIPEE
ncbi:MAG: hypothetical protein E7675_01605 [Ruminococcaceae bacterium]|nr:hypothetical protein [Oscillospiraceae bacterium]